MSEKTKKKNKNPFIAYFTPFGLRQTTDLLMLVGAIVIFVGIFTHSFANDANIVIVVGMSMYVVACCIAIYRCIRVMLKKDVNKRSAEFKNAIINICIMSVILVLAVLGIIAAFLW